MRAGSRTKQLLSGAWLGHPLHPALTDLPIGFWTSAWVLDVIELAGGRGSRDAARLLVGLGVLSAVPTAASGIADWTELADRGKRRLGVVHASANSLAFVSYAASWVARRRGEHGRGVAWGMAGATFATAAGYLGGRLAFRR